MLSLLLDGNERKLSADAQKQIIDTILEKGLEQFQKSVPAPAKSILEFFIIEEAKKKEIQMLKEGVSSDVIKSLRPKKGESYIPFLLQRFRPLFEGYIDHARVRLECNNDGEITHLFIEQQDQGQAR